MLDCDSKTLKSDGEAWYSLIGKSHLHSDFFMLCGFLSLDSNALHRNWWILSFCIDNLLYFAYVN